jgi:hypothetical protein
MIALVLCASLATHQVGLSRGTWTQDGAVVDAELVFKSDESPELAQHALEGIVVEVDGAKCEAALVGEDKVIEKDASADEKDGLAVRLRFTCGHAGRVTVEMAGLLSTLAQGHRHLGKALSAAGEQDVLVFGASSSFSFGEKASVGSYVWIGVEHIWFGFDHLVFLFGLILIGGRLRSLIGVVTAFTVAHSITLAIAVLGVWRPSDALIEPLIAASIAYVGIENFFVKDASKRWRITAPFGLIHGFGFAGALAKIGVPADEAPLVLFLFNLGVELGQLAILLVLLPLLIVARKKGVLNERVVKALSIVIVGLGVFWLVQRLI